MAELDKIDENGGLMMYFKEEDIDFSVLKDFTVFEELCFDLLHKLGFHTMSWRQGGPDNGRDIEAYYSSPNPLIGPYTDKWFIECKHYTNGVPVEEIRSKFDWAGAEQAQHLVIITSSYLSTSTRTWIDKRMEKEVFIFHLIERKNLVNLILAFPDLVSRYFKKDYEKLLLDSTRTWIYHNILPTRRALSLMIDSVEFKKITVNELSFIWTSCLLSPNSLETPNLSSNVNFNFDFLYEHFYKKENYSSQILNDGEIETTFTYGFGELVENELYRWNLNSYIKVNIEGIISDAYYTFVYSDKNNGIEILLLRNETLEVRVRFVQNDAQDYVDQISSILKNKM